MSLLPQLAALEGDEVHVGWRLFDEIIKRDNEGKDMPSGVFFYDGKPIRRDFSVDPDKAKGVFKEEYRP